MKNQKKRRIRLAAAALLLILLSGCAVQAFGGTAEKGKVIRVGCLDTEGFLYEDTFGGYYGYGHEYLERIAQETNWEYEYIFGNWEELQEKLKKGTIDFLAPIQSSDQRREDMEFGRYPIGQEYSLLYVREDNQDIYYDDFEHMSGLKIGAVKSWQQQKFLHSVAAENNLHYEEEEFDTEAEAVWALRSGDIDAAMLSSENYSSEFKLVGRWGAGPSYFVTSPGKVDLMEEMNGAVMHILVKDPQFQNNLYEKHYSKPKDNIWPEFTREEAEYIKASEEIPMILVTDRPAWSTLDESGTEIGIWPDILREIQRISGLKFKFVHAATGDTPIENVDGSSVFLAGNVICFQNTMEKENRIFSVKYAGGTVAAVGQEGFRSSLADRLTVAIPQKFKALEHLVRQNCPQYNLVGYSSAEKCMQAVQSGEADIMAEDSYVVEQCLQKPQFQSLQVLPSFSAAEDFCIAGVKGRDEILISILDKSIMMLDEDFIENSIIRNTVGMPYKMDMEDLLYKYRYPLTVAAGTLVLTVVYLFIFYGQQKNHNRILKEKNQELEEALTLAKEAGKAKGEFLSRMSHEMRTPLNAIIGFSELTEENREDARKVHDYHKKISVASDLLLRIINDILDMSAIEQNKMKLEQAPVNLEKLLEQVDIVYREQCKGKGIIYKRTGGGLPDVNIIGDSLRLSQVFLNLLSNAVKFTDGDGKIEVTVREEILDGQNLMLFVTVQDNGIGMSEEMKQKMFQPFEQENGSIARQYGGSGLGLSIVKGLVESMHGSVRVESGKDWGTAFYLEIPFAYQAVSPAAECKAQEKQDRNLCGLKLLLAEDNEMNAEIAREFLKILGAESDWAKNGREAVEMFSQAPRGKYSLILMDIRMPKMDGYAAARAIRGCGHPQAESIPIIAMTADAFQKDKEHAIEAGMNAHLTKPIDFEEMKEEIFGWI